MTHQAVEDLVPIAKSWLYAPELKLDDPGYTNEGYDPTQAAYVVRRIEADQQASLTLEIQASKDSPMINPALVIKNWGSQELTLSINGKTVERSADFRYGFVNRMEGTDLVVWIKGESTESVSFSLLP